MKSTFSWHFPLHPDEIDAIWQNGLFTVDANVLLDLYRYNITTRDNLLEVLEKIQDRVWLTNQTAIEFFKNRTNVIVDTQGLFDHFISSGELAEFDKSIDKLECALNGQRIFPKELTINSISELRRIANNTREAIRAEQVKFPDYLNNDEILEKLAILFEGKLGPAYLPEEKKEQIKIAEDRFANLIPPGFKDNEKDSAERYGDYFFWNQVLKKSKTEGKDIIIVTSERKEDWWEKIHGKTIGPRKELLEEAAKVAGQVILIYQTEYFLELAATKLKVRISPETVEEVKAVREEEDTCVELLEHDVTKSSNKENHGTIKFLLKRKRYKFTCSGHFLPHLSQVPKLDVKLVNSPENLPKYSVNSGTGTQFDFNIHVKSWDYGVSLPLGEYTFEYHASCDDQFESSQNDPQN